MRWESKWWEGDGVRSFQKGRRGSLLNTLECIAKVLVLYSVGNRESLMVSKHRSEVIRDAVFEGLARKIRAGENHPTPPAGSQIAPFETPLHVFYFLFRKLPFNLVAQPLVLLCLNFPSSVSILQAGFIPDVPSPTVSGAVLGTTPATRLSA